MAVHNTVSWRLWLRDVGVGSARYPITAQWGSNPMREGSMEYPEVTGVFSEPVMCPPGMMRRYVIFQIQTIPTDEHAHHNGVQIVCSDISVCYTCQDKLKFY